MREGRLGRWIGVRLAVAAVVAVGVVVLGFAAYAAGLPRHAGSTAHQLTKTTRCFVALRNESSRTAVRLDVYSPGEWQRSWPLAPVWAIAHALLPTADDVHLGETSPVFASFGTHGSYNSCSLDMRWDSWQNLYGSVSCHIYEGGESFPGIRFECNAVDTGHGIDLAVHTENVRGDESGGFDGYGGTVVVTDPQYPGGLGAPPPPKPVPPLLRTGDLHGRGWHQPTAGQTRQLLSWLTPTKRPRGCATAQQSPYDASSASPVGWLFVRNHNGQELTVGSVTRFARAAQARQAQATLVSAQAAHCLAVSIGTHKGITASAQRLNFGKVGDSSAAYRIVIRTSRRGKASYLDLVLLHKGRGIAMIGFYAENHQMASDIEQATANTLARRIKR